MSQQESTSPVPGHASERVLSSGDPDVETSSKQTRPSASGDTCVYVIGMHRSGTSATTGLLYHLGLGAPREADLAVPARKYERLWESRSLNKFDGRLLGHLGGTWMAPPRLSPEWWNDTTLDPLRAEASTVFAETFGQRPIAWKDPRLSIILPFWNSILDPPFASVLVYRDPFEVARSLHTRDHLRMTHGLALWERYLRSAATNLAGIPTLVMSYASLLEFPESRCDDLVQFLEEVGVATDRSARSYAIASLDETLHRERGQGPGERVASESTLELFEAFESLQGAHYPWSEPDLGIAPMWVEDTLETSLELATARSRYNTLMSSRSVRTVRKLGRISGLLSVRSRGASRVSRT
jgi:hypothetical protein